jgi:hypothetical protein
MPTKLTDLNRFTADNELRARYLIAFESAEEHGWPTWLDDSIPVKPDLLKFALEFRHKHRDAVFIVDTRPSRIRHESGEIVGVYDRVGVAFAQAPDMLVGGLEVGFDNVNNRVFIVNSPLIRNGRYRDNNPKALKKASKSFQSAMKAAGEYLKPFTFKRVHQESVWSVASARSTINDSANQKLFSVGHIPTEEILAEVRAMMAAGYQPTTAAFTKALGLVREQGEELNRRRNYIPHNKAFVWFQSDRAIYQYDGGEQTTVTRMEDMPQELRDKVAVLQIGSIQQPIIDVGVKVDDTKYWVFL